MHFSDKGPQFLLFWKVSQWFFLLWHQLHHFSRQNHSLVHILWLEILRLSLCVSYCARIMKLFPLLRSLAAQLFCSAYGQKYSGCWLVCFHMPEERHAMPHWDLASVVDLLKHVPSLWMQGGSKPYWILPDRGVGKNMVYGIDTHRDGLKLSISLNYIKQLRGGAQT